MSLHIGDKNIVDIRRGDKKIAKVYKGDKLVWGYTPEQVLFESSTPGTYPIYIKCRCKLYIHVVGAGGGRSSTAYPIQGVWHYWAASGGSGAYVYGVKEVTAGNYTITVGAGTSAGATANGGNSSVFGEVAGGGKTGTSSAGNSTGGAGGIASTTLNFINGNNGGRWTDGHGPGGASVYEGYGEGARSNDGSASVGGYVKIVAI